MLKRILELLRDSLAYGVGSILERLVGFILIPVYTRYLAPADYGVLAMLTILGALFEVLVFAGMKSSIFREFSLAPDEKTRKNAVSNGLLWTVISSAGVVGIAVLLSVPISQVLLGTSTHSSIIRVALLSSAFSAVGMVPFLVLQAARRAKTVSALSFVKLLVTVALTLLLVVGHGRGVWGVVVAQCISAGVFLIPQLWLLREYGLGVDVPMMARMVKYGLPLLPFRLQLFAAGAFAEYSVRSMLGLSEAGLYNVATRFALPLGFVVQAITQAWWPYKFHIFKEEKNPAATLRSITTYYFAVMNYLWVGVALFGPELLRTMTPVQFHPAVTLVPILALQRLLVGIYQMMTTGIELGDHVKGIGWVGFVGLVTGVGAAYALIPVFHAPGAALAACAAYLVMTIAGYRLAQTRYRVDYDWWTISGLTALAIGCVLVGYVTIQANGVTRLTAEVAMTLLYPAVALTVLSRSETERVRLRSAMQRLGDRLRRRKAKPL